MKDRSSSDRLFDFIFALTNSTPPLNQIGRYYKVKDVEYHRTVITHWWIKLVDTVYKDSLGSAAILRDRMAYDLLTF